MDQSIIETFKRYYRKELLHAKRRRSRIDDDAGPGDQIMEDKEIVDFMTDKADISATDGSDKEDENILAASEAFTPLHTALRCFEAQDERDQYQYLT
ncbi:hypothetical protein Trydic_g23142 [Trypoxylus dichotomus]